MLEVIGINEIHGPSGRSFVANQLRFAEHGICDAGSYHDSIWPGFIESDAGNFGDEVDSIRFLTDLEDSTRRFEVFDSQIVQRRTERSQCSPDTSRVFNCRADPDVQILRRARLVVRGQSVCTNNEELSPGVG